LKYVGFQVGFVGTDVSERRKEMLVDAIVDLAGLFGDYGGVELHSIIDPRTMLQRAEIVALAREI